MSPKGLEALIKALRSLSIDLLCEGYFVRGAVVKGPLYHDEYMVFGEALVRAHHFESQQARFPRIVVLRDVREDMLAYGAKGLHPKVDCLRQSADGPMYLNVLEPIVSLANKRRGFNVSLTEAERAEAVRYLRIRDKIQERYEESMDIPHNFEKVLWFAQYWNDAVVPYTDYQRVIGRGLGDRAF